MAARRTDAAARGVGLVAAARSVALLVAGLSGAGCPERHPPPEAPDPTCTATDSFIGVEPVRATILWVIDDSASMCEEQFNLRVNIQSFVESLRAAAPTAMFHMGVVTTDTLGPGAGRLRNAPVEVVASPACADPPPPLDCTSGLASPLPKWVDEKTPDLERTFACLASAGVSGAEPETPLAAAVLALGPTLANDPTANAGFYIPGSLLVVVFVSDADDCTVCTGDVCGPLPGAGDLDCALGRTAELTPVSDIAAYLEALPDGEGGILGDNGLLVASVTGLSPQGDSWGPLVAQVAGGADGLRPICSVPGQATAAPAPRLEAFTRSFDDHIEANVCDSDWAAAFAFRSAYMGTLSSGCLQLPPCPGATADDVVVHRTYEDVATTLAPSYDYDVLCAGEAAGLPPCPASATAKCPDGWRVEFFSGGALPPGRYDVLYACDGGDACAGPARP
ncbi:MAG TPA: hypothetical protein VG389_17570 [Myxococcota bacterium]|jgi:hypothetical protein|nr:hypothetical protein [Myxococcota bacterium]